MKFNEPVPSRDTADKAEDQNGKPTPDKMSRALTVTITVSLMVMISVCALGAIATVGYLVFNLMANGL